MGAINAALSCNLNLPLSQQHSKVPIAGATFAGFPSGTAASMLSLSTNVLATSLLGYKAWCVATSLGLRTYH